MGEAFAFHRIMEAQVAYRLVKRLASSRLSVGAGTALGLLALTAVVAGCGNNFGTRDNPELAACLGPATQQCVPLQEGTALAPIQSSRIPGQDSFYDIYVRNFGESDTELLNVYLGVGSNQYVTLEWKETDPTGEGAYLSGDKVESCAPDISVVKDPASLPAAAAPSANCVFPLSLKGDPDDTGAFGERRLRIRYSYDTEQVPDENPVILVMHFGYREDDFAPDGVTVVEIPVEGCTGDVSISPPSVEFTATPPNIDTQQICITNNGCAELELKNISFANPVAGDVFTFVDLPPNGTKLPSLNNPEGLETSACFTVRYAPTGAEFVANQVEVLTDDPVKPLISVPLSSGEACDYSYELEHSDLVESGKTYLDFSGVAYPDSAQKIITIRNTNSCPITLQQLTFDSPSDLKTAGGAFYAELRKAGATVGWVGFPPTPGTTSNPKIVLAGLDATMDAIIHFEPEENTSYEPTSVTLALKTGGGVHLQEKFLVQAGEPVPELEMAPSAGTSVISALYFSADSGETATRTFALQNLGLAPLEIQELELKGAAQGDFHLVDDGTYVVGGAFVTSTLDALGVIPVELEFNPTSGAFDADAEIRVHTEEYPKGGADPTPYTVVLQGFGFYNDPKPELPVANFGVEGGAMTVAVGQVVTVSGATSTGGAGTLSDQSYSFWLTKKPEGSAAFVNSQGKATSNFNADVAGEYEIRLTVFASGANNQFLYSDEAVLTVTAE